MYFQARNILYKSTQGGINIKFSVFTHPVSSDLHLYANLNNTFVRQRVRQKISYGTTFK